MKKSVLTLVAIAFLAINIFAQVAINTTGAEPSTSAILDLSSDSKGLLIPRMTTNNRTTVVTAVEGLLVFDTDTDSFWYWNNQWIEIANDDSMGINELTDGKADGSSVFLGNGAGANDDGSNYNSTLGFDAMNLNTSGGYNVSVGHSSMKNNTIGRFNVAIGRDANLYNQEGDNNTIIGYKAGRGTWHHNKTGNIFIGYQSGYLETGDNKLYIENSESEYPLIGGDFDSDFVDINGDLNITGDIKIEGGNPGTGKVLTSNIDGEATWVSPTVYASEINDLTDAKTDAANLFLGDESGINNTGDFNTGTGIQALKANTSGLSNTATGFGSLQYNNEGYENTASGHLALQNNTTGNANVAFGKESLLNNTTKSNLTAFGYQSLYYNGTGSTLSTQSVANTAIGSKSLYSNTLGSQNTAVGMESLKANTTGGGNTSTGAFALDSNTEGNNNTAGGAFALTSNIDGLDNTAFGFKSAYNITSGDYNAAFGSLALYAESTGTHNSAFGYASLSFNESGLQNTSVGYKTLRYNVSGSYNTAIGSQAGYNTTGSGNVFIGNMAGYNSILSNKLFIDNSNTNTPLIYGDFYSNKVGIGGFLGVNMIDPLYHFHVNGNAKINDYLIVGEDLNVGEDITVGDDINVGDDIFVTGDYKYASSKTKILKIPAASFGLSTNQDADKMAFSINGFWWIDNDDGNGAYNLQAGVNLPEGAIVTRFSFFYGGIDESITVSLNKSVELGNAVIMAQASASPTSITFDQYDDTSISYSTINNNDNFYFIIAEFTGHDDLDFGKLYGAEIEYTISELK